MLNAHTVNIIVQYIVQYLSQIRTGQPAARVQLTFDSCGVSMLSDTEASCVAIALAVTLEMKKSKKKRKWTKEWYRRRTEYTHENLLNDLRLSEPNDFRDILRLDGPLFGELLKMIAPRIEKRNTPMRAAIPPSQRLSITLCYLATGDTFEDLKFISAISPQSIGIIVMETCTALIHSLKDYIKVRTEY